VKLKEQAIGLDWKSGDTIPLYCSYLLGSACYFVSSPDSFESRKKGDEVSILYERNILTRKKFYTK
jgi:hypothetical protein